MVLNHSRFEEHHFYIANGDPCLQYQCIDKKHEVAVRKTLNKILSITPNLGPISPCNRG